jgi:hypothetical protein
MMTLRRAPLLYCIALAGMLLLLGHAAIRMADARSGAARAAANAADAASLADEIRSLRSGQRVASVGALRNDELARLTERAAAQAGIEREAIQRIGHPWRAGSRTAITWSNGPR